MKQSESTSARRLSLRLLILITLIAGILLTVAAPYSAQQPRVTSPIAPIKPPLPEDPPASGEKIIPLPDSRQNSRSRLSADSFGSLTEDQKILHLLNRAGFGPRPGDITRIRRIGIDRYIDEQLRPEEIPAGSQEDAIAAALQKLSTLQMTTPDMMLAYAPPPRPAPAPTPIPNPTPNPTQNQTASPMPAIPAITSDRDAENEMIRDATGKGEIPNQKTGSQPSSEMTQMPQLLPPQTQQSQSAMPAPTPATPITTAAPAASRRDPQQPLRELQQAKLLRAIFSEKQLQEVMVDFWFNHFNVWGNKDSARWMVTSYERDVIRPHALGNFKEILVAVAQSPAMLYYLDNFMSQAEMKEKERGREGEKPVLDLTSSSTQLPAQPPARRPGLNENYARELLELHTLGVDGGYTQQDVIEIARCFTGWTITPQPNSTFVFRPRAHDKGEKIVLGKRIPAGGGIEDGLRVLDILARHGSTARFVSQKLCRRFIADEPPASVVDRAAETFQNTGGDIREVVRTILTSPEFFSPKYYRNKIKSPLELTASAIRATGASTDAAAPLIQWVAKMGEPLYLYQPPTGYSEKSSEWMNNASLIERMNFAVAVTGNKINGTQVDILRLVDPGVIKDRDRLIDQLVAVLIHSDISDNTRGNLSRVITELRGKMVAAKYDENAARKNSQLLLSGLAALILGSGEFQVK